jgi:hypothetical protein
MAHDNERANVVGEMTLLRKQQLESLENLAFYGWSEEAKPAHDKRADRIALLFHRLAELTLLGVVGTP